MRTLVWFRGKELRIADHAPLAAALGDGEVIPVFVLDPYFFAPHRARELPHRMQFLLESLMALAKNLSHLGSQLLVVPGKSVEVIPRLCEKWRVDRVVSQRWTEPFARERDRQIALALRVPFDLFEGETLLAPTVCRSGTGAPYSVFTPFARAFALKANQIGKPIPAPLALPSLPVDVSSSDSVIIPALAELGIPHNPRLPRGGEAAARDRLRAFSRGPLDNYATSRDIPSLAATSGLSPDLKFGTVSPRTVWSAILKRHASSSAQQSHSVFQKQLLWREFAHATLWHRPDLLEQPFRPEFRGFPWRDDPLGWRAWIDGLTGYPLVDAAARQLYAEGFVHNRTRMVAASFLSKHLLIDFRRGEAHYMKYLVDGDWANNDMGWQWSAGTGCDAQPYFRVFNPTLQGQRFDPEGAYVKRWVPELAEMPAKFIHCPSEAPKEVLKRADVVLGTTYPLPCVNHAFARDRFLHAAEAHLRVTKRRGSLKQA